MNDTKDPDLFGTVKKVYNNIFPKENILKQLYQREIIL